MENAYLELPKERLSDKTAPWISLIELVAVAAGTASSVNGWGGPVVRTAAILMTLAGTFGLARANVLGPIQVRRNERAAAKLRLRAVLCRGTPAPLSDVNPYELGVFHSAFAEQFADGGNLPPYVGRDVDIDLREAVQELDRGSGGVIVVRGDPKSGKSRTLWEALTATVGTRIVYALRRPFGSEGPSSHPFAAFLLENLRIEGRDSIIWLDDAHEHFTRGLTDHGLDLMLERYPGIIVAITVHTAALAQNPLETDPTLLDRIRVASEPHLLNVLFSDIELTKARDRYPEISNTESLSRLPSWFAAVNLLRDRYRDNYATNPSGVGVAKAAIDWRRAGMPAGITAGTLRRLAEIELEESSPNERYSDDTYTSAVDWACEEVAPRASLLNVLPGTNHDLYCDHDAVTSWASTIEPPLSPRIWSFVLEHIKPSTGLGVSVAAYTAGEIEVASTALMLVATGSDLSAGRAMAGLGFIARERGDLSDAEEYWLKAVDLGSSHGAYGLGVLLQDSGNIEAAEIMWLLVASYGNPSAMHRLGRLAKERGDDDQAVTWWQKAAAMDSTASMHSLLYHHYMRGDYDEAQRWLDLSIGKEPQPSS